MNTFRPIISIIALFLLFIQVVLAEVDQNKLSIDRVLVDFSNNEIVIQGNKFNNGSEPSVNLGNYYDLVVNNYDNNSITASLPANNFVYADYKLTVTTGVNANQIASYDLTVVKGETQTASGGWVVISDGIVIGEYITSSPGNGGIDISVINDKGYMFTLEQDTGRLDDNVYFYFPTDDCSGTPYVKIRFARSGKGTVYRNNNQTYYSKMIPYITERMYSYHIGTNKTCRTRTGYLMVWPAEINDPLISGVNTYYFPIITVEKR